jgi:hypothetical protein
MELEWNGKENSMIRSALWFLAGAVTTLALLYAVVRMSHGRRWLLAVTPHRPVIRGGPGQGSGIRVVGGSITVELSKGLTFSPESQKQLSVRGADSSTFQLTNVSQQISGSPTTVIYPSLAGGWTIDELVTDSKRGVGINLPGSPNSKVTLTVENPNDTFGKGFLWIGLLLKQRYYNDNNPKCSDQEQCETVYQFIVTPHSGTQQAWYCRDPYGECDVDIGQQ